MSTATTTAPLLLDPLPMPPPSPHPPGTRALYWLAVACREARARARVSQKDVAQLAGQAQSSISRFEDASGGWPAETDRLVNAYATLAGLDDSRLLWRRMLELWIEHGAAPAPLK